MCARSASIFDFPDTVNEELLTHRRLPRCVGTYNARVNWVNERGERYDLTSADLALRRDRAADKYYKYREMRAASHDALETQHADCSGCASRSSPSLDKPFSGVSLAEFEHARLLEPLYPLIFRASDIGVGSPGVRAARTCRRHTLHRTRCSTWLGGRFASPGSPQPQKKDKGRAKLGMGEGQRPPPCRASLGYP